MNISLDCPMCNSSVEDLLHVFFVCPFVVACWHYVGMFFDMALDENAQAWLLSKLRSASVPEVLTIARMLWGIWFFRNKRVWENRVVTTALAMDWSAKSIVDWRDAKYSRFRLRLTT